MFYKTVRRFLDPDGSQGGAPAGEQTDQQSQQNATPQIDYGKIQQMLDGTLAAKEDTALKAYFKQQGLSQQEVEQAIATFKEQKAANQPNVEALQQQAATAAAEARTGTDPAGSDDGSSRTGNQRNIHSLCTEDGRFQPDSRTGWKDQQ